LESRPLSEGCPSTDNTVPVGLGPPTRKANAIDVIQHIKDMQRYADRVRSDDHTMAFVPTMGFLHEGHLSLCRIGRERGDVLAASIFVNPAQFGPTEDFDTYPRNLERDLSLLEKEGVDVVFTPTEANLYPEGYQTYVNLTQLPEHLCGLSRPVFFRGVATVVIKLFHIVKPHVAVFGEKDFQQLQVIRRMVADLDMDIEIEGGPIVRESDGLAMSSRNSYLGSEQRPAALSLYRALCAAKDRVGSGETDAAKIIQEATESIGSYPDTDIDYVTVCDPITLDDISRIDDPALMALAVKVGQTRLIDNMILAPPGK